jgi:hypothetical protein
VECGFRLPPSYGVVPELRRRWLRRVGWYPGDWIWTALLTLAVATAGAAAAIAVTEARDSGARRVYVTPTDVGSVHEPTTAPASVANTATLPTAPEPTVTGPARTAPAAPPAPPNGRTPWPKDRDGWTLFLMSYPKEDAAGREAALAAATRAAKARLPEVGILDSSRFASLHPGYYVVFSGIYSSQGRAITALRTARASGFSGAYPRAVSR